MNCLRCGRELEDDRTFCDHCLQSMEKYPVRPGTAVMLPKRKDPTVLKKTKLRLPPTPAEQIRKLRRQRTVLSLAALILAALLAGSLFLQYRIRNDLYRRPGQNYSAVETPAATE